MNQQQWKNYIVHQPVILDGGTGSGLRNMGMPTHAATELWVKEHPEILIELQRAFCEAGAQIIFSPTFRAQPAPLKKAGYVGSVEKLNELLVRVSRSAAADKTLVAGDLTTLSGALPVQQEAAYPALVEQYRTQIRGLMAGGADLLVGETLIYLQEARAILEAADLENCMLPVMISFTMKEDGTLFSGKHAGEALREAEQMGAAATGFNCVPATEELPALAAKLRRYIRGPLISKPNAGIPVPGPDGRLVYPLNAEKFAKIQKEVAQIGAGILGGCCGTTPDYIRSLKRILVQSV